MFLAEIIVGYKTSSLALIADAFHMLSDVLSQIIALYSIRVRKKEKTLSCFFSCYPTCFFFTEQVYFLVIFIFTR